MLSDYRENITDFIGWLRFTLFDFFRELWYNSNLVWDTGIKSTILQKLTYSRQLRGTDTLST